MVYMWMLICVVIMLIRPFFCRPALYNSLLGTYQALPFISDDPKKEAVHYATLILTITNMSFLVMLILPYVGLCYYVLRRGKPARMSIDKVQAVLFCICCDNAIAAILYNIMKFVEVPRAVVIISHVMWQLSHGIHGVVYVCVNKQIRKHVKGFFGCETKSNMVFVPKTTNF
ncbi:hypothetical protein COOONC_09401 [Cooperia oncophora]